MKMKHISKERRKSAIMFVLYVHEVTVFGGEFMTCEKVSKAIKTSRSYVWRMLDELFAKGVVLRESHSSGAGIVYRLSNEWYSKVQRNFLAYELAYNQVQRISTDNQKNAILMNDVSL